jgi:hypothetical protein
MRSLLCSAAATCSSSGCCHATVAACHSHLAKTLPAACVASGAECSAVQCSAVQCSAVQCSAVQCSAVQCSAVQCSAVQCSAVQCSAVHTVAWPMPWHGAHRHACHAACRALDSPTNASCAACSLLAAAICCCSTVAACHSVLQAYRVRDGQKLTPSQRTRLCYMHRPPA